MNNVYFHKINISKFAGFLYFYAYNAHMQNLCIVADFYESCSICRDVLLINIIAVN